MTTPSSRHFAKEGLFISADARAMPMGRSSGEYSNLALQTGNSGLVTNCTTDTGILEVELARESQLLETKL